MRNYLFLCLLSLFCSSGIAQQKKRIDHTVYDSWNSLKDVRQSPTGAWISYEINPAKGDGNLYLYQAGKGLVRSFARGTQSALHYEESFMVFTINPEFDTVRKLKLDGVKDDKLPKDSLGIYWFATDSLRIIPSVKSFKLSEKGDWLAVLSEKNNTPACPKKCKKHKKKGCPEISTSGTSLTVMNPVTGVEFELHQVVDYTISKNGNTLAFTRSLKGKSDTLSLYVLDLGLFPLSGNQDVNVDVSGLGVIDHQYKISGLEFAEQGNQLVFLTSSDTCKKKNYELVYWKSGMEKASIVVDSLTSGMPEGYTVSSFRTPHFSKDGKKIFLGTNLIVRQDPKDTLLDTEKAKVDIWRWNDGRIQPQQLKELRSDQRASFMAVYYPESNSFIQLADEEMTDIQILYHGETDFAIGYSDVPYLKERTWVYPWRSDVYFVNLRSGERKLIHEGAHFPGSVSPSGNSYVWYEARDSSWYHLNLKSGDKTNMTRGRDVFFSDNNGQPTTAFPEGSTGWVVLNNQEFYMANARRDVWALSADQTFCLTNHEGEAQDIIYRFRRLERDSAYLQFDLALLHSVDYKTKTEAFSKFTFDSRVSSWQELISSNHTFVYTDKAEKSDRLLFRRMNFTDYPDLEATDLSFTAVEKITVANPQQEEYNWGTVEMVSWSTYEGRNLRGLLYKPEDFDSTKSYPKIVYYYEKYTEDIHLHYVPKPTASIVYPTEYVSNGYIIFIPDIEYTPGHPAKSAYDCIMSGTDHLIRNNTWIDSTRMGLQGQSWGGYQTAQLVTMTDRYAAAMAGAPVSNMFSAYGGIRWGSGLSRMFQYEATQSRIGYTIWERPDLYIENSPVFGLPNVSTPLLIMHNDGDGAVPWYQGIELYMGLRRLGKEAWLLNYNDDEHNLMKIPNRLDLSIRMRQFFDHYLLGTPAPEWMEEGVPAIDKGVNTGYELNETNQ